MKIRFKTACPESLAGKQIKAAGTITNPKINPSLADQRITSLDAYRGFIISLMMSEVLSFRHVSEALSDNSFVGNFYFSTRV